MKKTYKFIQHHGWFEFFRRFWIIITKIFFQRRNVLIYRFRNDRDTEYESDLNFKDLSRSNIKEMVEVMYLSEYDINKRFNNSDRCFAIIDKNKIATYVWGQFKIHWMEELLLKFKLTSNQVWLYNGVTIKSARGKGYYKNILVYIGKVLRTENFTEIYGYAEERNIPSIRGLEKASYIKVVMIHMKKIFSKIEYKVNVFDEESWHNLKKTIANFENNKWIIESG